jgi:hypothetical protein
LPGAAQGPEHPLQPGQGFPAGGFDDGQRLACHGGLGVDDAAARAGLDRDDADAVRNRVVHLAGDPQPL